MDPTVILFGLGVGLLVGITGMGGGTLMTPLLILVIGTKPIVAVGTDLAYGAVTKTLGGWRHFTKGTVFPRLAFWLAVGSCPAALVGVWLIDRLHSKHGDSFDGVLLACVAGALFVVALSVIGRALFMPKAAERERHSVPLHRGTKRAAVIIGLVLGAILGVTSVGSGALIGLVLILLYKLSPRRVVGTDVFHAAVLLWTAGMAHFISGNVDLGLMATILIGSLPGVWIGTALVPHVPVVGLRYALGIILAAASLGVLSKAGVEVHPAVIVGVPAALSVLSWVVHRRHPVPAYDAA